MPSARGCARLRFHQPCALILLGINTSAIVLPGLVPVLVLSVFYADVFFLPGAAAGDCLRCQWAVLQLGGHPVVVWSCL
jgi:hypothetical protein